MCRFYHVVFIESFQKLWKDDVTGMLHKVTAGGRIIHMEDKEIIGILDGLISKRVRAKGYDEPIFARKV